MVPRTLVLIALIVLLTATLASVLTPRDLDEGRGARVLAEAAARPAPGTAARVVTARLPQEEPVDVRVGDVVDLTIRSSGPDVARVPDLGFDVAVGPDVPGALRVVADRPGRFEVRLDLAQRRVGVLRVRPRAGS